MYEIIHCVGSSAHYLLCKSKIIADETRRVRRNAFGHRECTISSSGLQSRDTPTYPPALRGFPLILTESIKLAPIARPKGSHNSERVKSATGIREKGGGAHLRQFADEIVSVRFLGRFDHLLLGYAVISVTDVLPYRCVKEYGLLTD